MSELVKVLDEGVPGLSGVCIGPDGIYISNKESGEVKRVTPDGLEIVCGLGSVRGLTCHDGQMVGVDTLHQRVFRLTETGAPTDVVKEYQGAALIGPTGVCVSHDGTLFFVDGGDMGQTPLSNPRGSLMMLNLKTMTLSAVAHAVLAQPSGVAVSPDGNCLYVCESAQNRILRFVQRPQGAWHGSVFFQFAGMYGPTCVDVDQHGNLYVGRSDFSEVASTSTLAILRPSGEEYASLSIPGAELSAVCIDKSHQCIYLAEASKGVLYKYTLPTP